MNAMSAQHVESADLLDLKLLPAWVKETGSTNHYDHYTGEEAPAGPRKREHRGGHTDRQFRSRQRRQDAQRPTSRPDRSHRGTMPRKESAGRRDTHRPKNRRGPDHVVEQAPPKPFEG